MSHTEAHDFRIAARDEGRPCVLPFSQASQDSGSDGQDVLERRGDGRVSTVLKLADALQVTMDEICCGAAGKEQGTGF